MTQGDGKRDRGRETDLKPGRSRNTGWGSTDAGLEQNKNGNRREELGSGRQGINGLGVHMGNKRESCIQKSMVFLKG